MVEETRPTVGPEPPGGAMEEDSKSMLEDRLKKIVPKGDLEAFKTAVFNTGLFVFVGICLTGAFAVYKLMYAFLKPMMWAVLVGTVIFPFKRTVTEAIRGWLRGLRESGTPLALGVLFLPLSWLDSLGECIWKTVTSQTVFYVIGGYVGLKFLTYERAFIALLRILSTLYSYLNVLILIFSKTWVRQTASYYFLIQALAFHRLV